MCVITVHVHVCYSVHHVGGVKPQLFHFEGKHIVIGVVCSVLLKILRLFFLDFAMFWCTTHYPITVSMFLLPLSTGQAPWALLTDYY